MSSITSPGSSKNPILSIVIVNWNARDLLAGCLLSLREDEFTRTAEIIVLDSASSDDSAAMVADEFPSVTLMAFSENLGYSRGNNVAIRRAAGEYILLLNPDTKCDRGTIAAMVELARKNPEIGIVGPAQRGGDGVSQYEAAVNCPTVWNVFCDLALLSKFFPKSRLFASRTMGYWDHGDTREVPAVPGSALLVRRSVLQQIGLLDETLFCCEDIDLCVRTRNAGSKVYFLGEHSLIHYGGGSTKHSPSQGLQRQIAFQSFWLFLRKHRGIFAAAQLSAMVAAWALGGILLALLMRIAAGRDAEKLSAASRYRDLVRSLAQWSRMDKLRFRHHLAAPPDTSNSTPNLETTTA
jgi:GT2 family glycosyltransferase